MQLAPVTANLPISAGNAAPPAGVEKGGADGMDFSVLLKAQIKGGMGRGSDPGTNLLEVASDREAVAKNVNVANGRLAFVADAVVAEAGKPSADTAEIAAVAENVEQLPTNVSQEMPIADPVSLDAVEVDVLKVKPKAGHQTEAESGREDGLLPPVGVFMQPAAVALPQARSDAHDLAPSGKISVENRPASGSGDIRKSPDVLVGKESPHPAISSAVSGRQAEFAVDGKNLPQMPPAAKDKEPLAVLVQPSAGLQQATPDNSFSSFSPAMMVTSHAPLNDVRTASVSQNTLQAPVGSSAWGDALGQKVVWMAGQQTQVAELHLNPPNLGPMEVRLSISNDQISAIFVSHQPAVREAIEAAMPRLREMLADSGMSLGNASVSSDSLPQQQFSGSEERSGHSRQSGFPVMNNALSVLNSGGVIPLRRDGTGMVDLFA